MDADFENHTDFYLISCLPQGGSILRPRATSNLGSNAILIFDFIWPQDISYFTSHKVDTQNSHREHTDQTQNLDSETHDFWWPQTPYLGLDDRKD